MGTARLLAGIGVVAGMVVAAPGQSQTEIGAEPSPYLEKSRPTQWTLVADMTVRGYKTKPTQDRPAAQDEWAFTTATIAFPLVTESGSSEVTRIGGDPAGEAVQAGYMEVGDRRVDAEPEVTQQTYHSGMKLTYWRVPRGEYTTKELGAHLEIELTSYRVAFDEQKASRVDWPAGAWPDSAQSTLQNNQMFVEVGPDARGAVRPYNMQPVANLIEKWTDGNDPKKIRPVVLAKWIAGSLAQEFQPSGVQLASGALGFEGFALQGAAQSAIDMRGSEFDMVCLLAALYREAGLPARVVIGYDAEASKGKRNFLKSEKGEAALRAWVEFCLYDDSTDSTGWVPVDIVEMRKSHSRLPSGWMNKKLKYFGDHDELDGVVPISFHFHPPANLVAFEFPTMWGLDMLPARPVYAEQGMRISATRTASRGGRR